LIKRAIQRLMGWDRLSERDQYLARYRFNGVVANLIALVPISLPRLFRWFGSDKQRPGWHDYGPTYASIFRPWKYRPVRLLEIGIGGYGESPGGASLLSWQAFFPFGRIIGADIEDKSALTGWRRDILNLDQSSPTQLTALSRNLAPFDIIIDDGSHLNAHQILTFEHLFAALKDGGIYVVEDVQTSFWPGAVAGVVWDGATIDDPRFKDTCHGYFLELSKYLNQAEFIDRTGLNASLASRAQSIRRIAFEHNMIIILKGDNRDSSVLAGRLGS
jgi:hypothetical protein